MYYYKWDVVGLGIAGSVTNFLLYLCVIIYSSTIEELKPAIFLPERDTFENVDQYLRYGIPSLLMMCLEWWSMEVTILSTGYLGVNQQAAQMVLVMI